MLQGILWGLALAGLFIGIGVAGSTYFITVPLIGEVEALRKQTEALALAAAAKEDGAPKQAASRLGCESNSR